MTRLRNWYARQIFLHRARVKYSYWSPSAREWVSLPDWVPLLGMALFAAFCTILLHVVATA